MMAALNFIDPTFMPVASTFILIFAIVFGLLSSVKMLGGNKAVNAAIAAVFAVFAASYAPLVQGLQEYIPLVAIGLVVVFFIIFIKNIFGGAKEQDNLPMVVSLVLLLILLGVFWDDLSRFLPFGIDSASALWIIGIIVVVMIFFAAYKHKSS